MGIFDQMGDPVCPDCLCQHHGAAYAEFAGVTTPNAQNPVYDLIANGAAIVQVQIVTTERCCIVVNAATLVGSYQDHTRITIERPLGTDRISQLDTVITGDLKLTHYAAWEVLPPGVYTYFLANNIGAADWFFAAWIKAVASDCEG